MRKDPKLIGADYFKRKKMKSPANAAAWAGAPNFAEGPADLAGPKPVNTVPRAPEMPGPPPVSPIHAGLMGPGAKPAPAKPSQYLSADVPGQGAVRFGPQDVADQGKDLGRQRQSAIDTAINLSQMRDKAHAEGKTLTGVIVAYLKRYGAAPARKSDS